MYSLDPRIVFKAVHTFYHEWNKKCKMVNVTVEMPHSLWKLIHEPFFSVDAKGKVLSPDGCGRQGCRIKKPKGMAVNGPCLCSYKSLRWEQKNRKEKHK